MKIIDTDVICVASMHEPNTWHIFRKNGVEITITLDKGKLKSSHELTPLEIEYLNNNLR